MKFFRVEMEHVKNLIWPSFWFKIRRDGGPFHSTTAKHINIPIFIKSASVFSSQFEKELSFYTKFINIFDSSRI